MDRFFFVTITEFWDGDINKHEVGRIRFTDEIFYLLDTNRPAFKKALRDQLDCLAYDMVEVMYKNALSKEVRNQDNP